MQIATEMKYFPVYLYIVCLALFTSCSPNATTEMPEDDVMNVLFEEKTDSLASVLEEKISPFELPDAGRADYAFWLAKLHQRQRRSLINDTLIHFAVDFYIKTDSPRLPEAYMLAAEQADWSNLNATERISLLEKALRIVDQRADTMMARQIMPELESLYDEHNQADGMRNLIALSGKYAGRKNNVPVYRMTAKLFGAENKPDSASKYTKLALELAREEGDRAAEYELARSYVNQLNIAGRNQEALSVLRDMESRMEVGNELKLNYTVTWIGLGQLDSARACIRSFQPLLDMYRGDIEVDILEATLGMCTAVILTKEGKPFTFNEAGKSLNRVMDKSRNRIRIDRERQYAQNKLLKDNLMLDIERGQLRQRILWLGIIVLAIIAALIFFFQRKLLIKERSIRTAKEQLQNRTIQLKENESVIAKNEELIRSLSTQLDENGELKQEMEQLAGDNESLRQNNQMLQKEIEQYSKSIRRKDEELYTYEKLIEDKARLQERERFLTAQVIAHTEALDRLSKKPRYIDESQWPEIIHAVNGLFDGFSYRLHTEFPALTEEDVRYCCLIKLRLTTSVTSTLTGISPSSVTKRKQRIREKIRKDQPLEIYLWNY
ncbi:MAG: hypothetical protein LBL58_05155 [Tannerellaceae bacterium]|jgi:hypothetical protein|nr:hypothetical protein [Tannerellaceae bacterium]